MDNNRWSDLCEHGTGSVYHSLEWANARKLSGEEPIFIDIAEEGKIVAGIVAFEKIKEIPMLGEKKILFSEGNPLVLDKKYAPIILKKFMETSEKYFYGTIYPTVKNFDKNLFENAGFKAVINNTVLIDLSKSLEELMQNLEKKSARWGVKSAEKNSLTFGLAKENEVDEFYQMYAKTASDGGFECEQKEFLTALMNTKVSKLFVVKKNDQIVCGGLILIDKSYKYSILNLTSASEEGLKLQAMPFLYWNIIKYSKEIGLNYFDLGGFDKEAEEGDKTYNINKFKERFGGQIEDQPICATNSKYPLLRKGLKVYKKIKHLKK